MIIKVKSELKGKHIHTKIFVGETTSSLALSGCLILQMGEWQLFNATLCLGAKQTLENLHLIFEGEDQVIEEYRKIEVLP